MTQPNPTNPWAEEDRQSTAEHWAHLTIIGRYRAPLYLTNQMTGETYLADSHGGPWMWKLQCDCGHTFEIEAAKFPGRRTARSCNRPECPHSRQEPGPEMPIGRPVGKSGAVFTIYLPNDVINLVKEYCSGKPVSFSKGIARLIRNGAVSKLLQE